MSAEFVDALKGYEYYLRQRGEATIDDVNHHLETHGRRPIQLRTYGHYRKLLTHGFRSYIPINQFDVFQTLGKLQMAADRRRYQRDSTRIPASLSRDATNWQEAVIMDRSPVGFGITASGRVATARGGKIWVKIEGYEDIPTIVIWKHFDATRNTTRLGVRAFEFIAKYNSIGEVVDTSKLTGLLQVSRGPRGILGWGDVYRIMEKTNELLEAVSSLLYSVDNVQGARLELVRPVLASIRFGSPGALRIKIDPGIAEIINALIAKVQFWSLQQQRFKHKNRKLELQNLNYGLEVVRNAINLRKEAIQADMSDEAIAAILKPVRGVFDMKRLPRGLFGAGTPERGVLIERVMPAITELVTGDDPDFHLEIVVIKKRRGSLILGHPHGPRRDGPRR